MVGAITAFLAWLGAACAAYVGHKELAKALVVVFAACGFGGALAWVIHCAQIALQWLSQRRGRM
jgi:hypothetical protein